MYVNDKDADQPERAAASAGVMEIDDEDGQRDGNQDTLTDQRMYNKQSRSFTFERHLILASSMPLRSLGVVDVAANDVTDNDVLAHALLNVSDHDKAQGWAVRRSSDFVNEYPRRNSAGELTSGTFENPNHLLGSFPCLFPYGCGGLEVQRSVKVSYEAHVRWCLRYHDKRFRLDLHFIFQVFGVLQKREMCSSASLQISKRAFQRHEAAIRNLKPEDLAAAGVEEQAGKSYSHPVIRSLRSNLTSIRAKVMGTDESRIKIRSRIWGMCMMKNPPSVWLTINPADTQDPIAQVLTGQEIDLDNFNALDMHPSPVAVASDPFASAAFFHHIVNAVLDSLLGIKARRHNERKSEEKGILGTVSAYIGTVEAQGRGTLHVHMVLWLKGSVTLSGMKELLMHEDFRNRVKAFIHANVRADLPGYTGGEVLALPKANAVAFSRPVDPRKPHYRDLCGEAERKLARTVQVHSCGPGCMKVSKSRLVCKRRAPFVVSDFDWVNANGDCGPKRTYGYFNNWNPAILQCVRSNHDIKLILNGMETKDIAWYITNYIIKKRKKSTNTSALLARTLAFHHDEQPKLGNLRLMNKRLIQRCANTLSRQQELSAPEVISYLMGWGDRFESHHFVTIHWYSVMNILKKVFPELRAPQ